MAEPDITGLRLAASQGESDALDRVFPVVHEKLKTMARKHLRSERQDHTLGATALVHEAFLKLIDQRSVTWESNVARPGQARSEGIVAVDEALQRLAAEDPRAAQLVELRYFGGMTIGESAKLLGISNATAKRDWVLARAWLQRALG